MGDEGAFYLCCTDTMSGDLDDIINTAHQPEVAILIYAGSVSGSVITGKALEIGGFEAARVAVNGTHQTGPGFLDTQITAFIYISWCAVFS